MNISIVTITFNNFDELVKTLSSTENLNCEQIVINGGSCAKTKELLNARTDIVSISEKDKGISDAFNKGLALATRKGIWFLNSGDTCNDRNFISFVDQKLNDFDFVYSPIIFDDPVKGQHIMEPLPDRSLGLGMTYLHPGLVLSKKIFDEVGNFDLSFKIAMDYEVICRMSKKNYQGAYYSKPTVVMDGSGVSKQKPFKGHIELGRALLKNKIMLGLNLPLYIYRTLKLGIRQAFYTLKLGFAYEAFKNAVPPGWRK